MQRYAVGIELDLKCFCIEICMAMSITDDNFCSFGPCTNRITLINFLVLQGFGTGNIAVNQELLATLDELYARGCVPILA
jgi:hypothetical protein